MAADGSLAALVQSVADQRPKSVTKATFVTEDV
jgi:hypothetical protein